MAPMQNRLMVPRQEPGILDFAPGAAAAYSLRNLSLSYTGPVVTVRRSTDNAERDFTAAEVSDGTLAGWAGADGFVKQWWDQSGNARHATASGTAQPQIVDSGVLVTEGVKAAVRFDGAGDELSTGAFATGQAVSLFTIAKADAWHRTANYDTIFSHGYETATTSSKGIVIGYLPNGSFSGWNAGDIVSFGSGYGGAPKAIGAIASGSDLRHFAAILGAVTSVQYMNGATVAASTSTTGSIAAISSPVLLGSSRAGVVSDMLAGAISELIYYQTDMTSSRTRITGNQMWYY